MLSSLAAWSRKVRSNNEQYQYHIYRSNIYCLCHQINPMYVEYREDILSVAPDCRSPPEGRNVSPGLIWTLCLGRLYGPGLAPAVGGSSSQYGAWPASRTSYTDWKLNFKLAKHSPDPSQSPPSPCPTARRRARTIQSLPARTILMITLCPDVMNSPPPPLPQQQPLQPPQPQLQPPLPQQR